MKNKRKNIIIVVCVLVAAAIAVCAGVGYHYSRPERTAEKVLTAVFTADEAEDSETQRGYRQQNL